MAGMSDAETLWRQVLEELRLQMTRATFDTWLRNTRVIEADEGSWTVWVAHHYALDWLSNRLAPTIERTVRRIAGNAIRIRFAVSPPPAPGPLPAEEIEADPDMGEQPILEAVQEERVTVRGDGSTLVWTDYYIKLKLAFRAVALRRLRGARLPVWLCLALHMDKHGVSSPGIEQIMQETGIRSRSTVCSALEDLARLRLVEKLPPSRFGTDRYRVIGYAWFGRDPAPSLFELDAEQSQSPKTGL